MKNVRNFGRNVVFRPASVLKPRFESEIIDILRSSTPRPIRTMGSRHAWSELLRTAGTIIDMSEFRSLELFRQPDGSMIAIVGGGSSIGDLLTEIERRSDFTLPTIGTITKQTIAGAISTGTHGSGHPSISHYVTEIRSVAYDPTGIPRVHTWSTGDELRAARCALGCLGIITMVKIRCVPKYAVGEQTAGFEDLRTLVHELRDYPLSHFLLIPYGWRFVCSLRRPVHGQLAPSLKKLVRYWRRVVTVDFGFHLGVRLLAVLRARRMTISLYRALAHRSEKLRTPEQCDVASRVLTLHHYWFRHVEMEVAVPEASLPQAVAIVAHLVAVCAGVADADFSHGVQAELRGVGLGPALDRTSGSYVHHYPVSFRSLRAEDTLLSVTSGSTTTWYTIGLFSYCRLVDLHRFRGFCDLVATALSLKCGGRCHWGKLQPSAGAPAMPMHPGVAPFDDFRRSVDPDGSFVSDAVTRAVGVPISGRP